MKQGSNGKGRLRGRNPQAMNSNGNGNGNKGRGPSRNQVYDSNGPGIRVRGNAHQVVEKYQALARDASAQGDRVLMENYLQHAEHYYRIILAINAANPQLAQRSPRLDQNNALSDGDDYDDIDENDDESADGEFAGEAQVYEAGQAYQQLQNAEQGQREQGQRDQGQRDQGQRDQGQREQGFRGDRNNRDQNRDHNQQRNQQTRDPNQRQQNNRDGNQPRHQGNRDPQNRDFNRRDNRGQQPYGVGTETGVTEGDAVVAAVAPEFYTAVAEGQPAHDLPIPIAIETEGIEGADAADADRFGERPRRRSRSQRARDSHQRESASDEQARELARILAESGETNLLEPPRFQAPAVEAFVAPAPVFVAPVVEAAPAPVGEGTPPAAPVSERGPVIVETVKRPRKRRVVAAPESGDLLEAASVAE